MPEPTVVEEKGRADVEAGLPRQVTAGDRDPAVRKAPRAGAPAPQGPSRGPE